MCSGQKAYTALGRISKIRVARHFFPNTLSAVKNGFDKFRPAAGINTRAPTNWLPGPL
jgi:hypothetical protein